MMFEALVIVLTYICINSFLLIILFCVISYIGGSTVGGTVTSNHSTQISSVNNLNTLSIPSNMLLQLHQLNSNNHPEFDIEKGSTIPAYAAGELQ